MKLDKLFTGVAMASALAATAPAAEAQIRSPAVSSMQPQSTFTPPAGATVYRDNGDGTSTRVSPQDRRSNQRNEDGSARDFRGYYGEYERAQTPEEAYRQGRAAGEYEARSRRESDSYYAKGPSDQIGCGATYNGGSWLNRGIGRADRSLGRDGREIAGVLGMRGSNITADMQAQCRINSIEDPEQRARVQGRSDSQQEERFRRNIEDEASRRIFGRSPNLF